MTLAFRYRHPPAQAPAAPSGPEVARALEHAVEEIDAPGRGLGCVPPEHRVLILAARREMLALSTDLLERPASSPEAVAIAAEVARRGAMPLFSAAGARRALEQSRAARAQIVGAAQRPA
jgi:hypothetical protein